MIHGDSQAQHAAGASRVKVVDPLPTHTLGAVLYELGKPLRLEELAIPALGRGHVLVEVAFSGVCRSQVMEVRGGRGEDRWLPHLLGHEGSGTVLAVGEAVTKVQPGDNVVLTWIRSAGINAGGPTYSSRVGVVNAGPVTTFATHSVVAESRVVRLPAGLPMDIAVLFGCALPTGAGMVLNELRPKAGSSMVVYGLGGVGFSALLASLLAKCDPIIAVDVSTAKLDAARLYGATHVVNASEEDPVAAVYRLTAENGADFAVEAAGTTRTIEQAFKSVRKFGGRCLFASHPETGKTISLDPHDLVSGRNIGGSWGGATDPDRDVPALAQRLLESGMPLDEFLQPRYSLFDVNRALDELEAHQVRRPLLQMR